MLVVIVSGALVLGAHESTAQVPDSARARANARASESWAVDSTRRARLLNSVGPELRRLGTMHWTIPEYHDEQRLLDGAGDFGPMANIFASPMLGGFTKTWQIEEQGEPGLLVALVAVDPPAGGGPLPQTYQNLNLEVGINCLWLWYDRAAPPAQPWKGRVSVVDTNRECDRRATMQDLAVVQSRHPSHTNHADYPGVGRFSETTNGQPLLGTKCLDAWCEFGPAGFAPTNPSGNSGREDRVKGWHDEQRLAEIDAAGVPKPGPRAVVIPFSKVDEHPETYFTTWRRVARIRIVDPLSTTSKYYKSGLRQGMNVFEIRKVGSVWRARVTSPGGRTQEWMTDVRREVPHDAAVPGTSRFRFSSRDDGVWVPCGQACCRAEVDA